MDTSRSREIRKRVGRMTVEETKYGWTFTMNPPCHVYTCANCPYRKGYCCMYESEKRRE